MKQYTHAWLSFMAIKRLEKAKIPKSSDRACADDLVDWFKEHNDDVIQGAWYPDAIVKDMTNSHVLKIKPSSSGTKNATNEFKPLPMTYHCYRHRDKSPMWEKYYLVDSEDNLPDRCESIAQSVIDHLKMQCCEDVGSPVSPTNNQIGLLLFMLSHYVADAHVPFHCDARKLDKLHAGVEKCWDKMVRRYFEIDKKGKRFFYNKHGYPEKRRDQLEKLEKKYQCPYLSRVERDIRARDFVLGWGGTKEDRNNNVWDFITAICQHSYLLAYSLAPMHGDSRKMTLKCLATSGSYSLDNCSYYVLSDAIDSIARVWFRVWRHYLKWRDKNVGDETAAKQESQLRMERRRRRKVRSR